MPRKPPEVMVIAFDGAVPSFIDANLDRVPLPAFAELKRRGVWFTDCRPAFPSITPTCWSSLATGATPATHGAVDQDYHPPESSDPLALVTAYHGDELLAERFWEAAARMGKRSLILQMPVSGPRRSDRVLQVSGTGCAAIGGAVAGRPTVPPAVEVPAVLFRIGSGERDRRLGVRELSPASGQWNPDEALGVSDACRGGGAVSEAIGAADGEAAGEAVARPVREAARESVGRDRSDVSAPLEIAVDTGDSVSAVEPFSWFLWLDGDCVHIAESADRSKAFLTLRPGEWSPALERTLETGAGTRRFRYRTKLIDLDAAEGRLTVYFTPMGDLVRSSAPAEFTARIADYDEVPAHTGNSLLLYDGDPVSYLEAEAFSLGWQRAVIEDTLEREDIDIVVTYAVFLDSINHRYRNDLEGISDVSEPERRRSIAAYEKAYRLADDHLGKLLALCGDETDVVVVSDHGSVGYTSIFRPEACLESAGLLRYQDVTAERAGRSGAESAAAARPRASTSASERREINWESTKVYPLGTCYLRVNLRGREACGVVSPSEYESVVNEAIGALKGFVGESGVSPVAFAVPRDQAGFVGLGGDRCGDVVYGLSGSYIGGHVGGVHACQIPTAKTETGDIRSVLIMAGPSFRSGVLSSRAAYLWDIAPTICHARRYPQPADAEGAVLTQALSGAGAG